MGGTHVLGGVSCREKTKGMRDVSVIVIGNEFKYRWLLTLLVCDLELVEVDVVRRGRLDLLIGRRGNRTWTVSRCLLEIVRDTKKRLLVVVKPLQTASNTHRLRNVVELSESGPDKGPSSSRSGLVGLLLAIALGLGCLDCGGYV